MWKTIVDRCMPNLLCAFGLATTAVLVSFWMVPEYSSEALTALITMFATRSQDLIGVAKSR